MSTFYLQIYLESGNITFNCLLGGKFVCKHRKNISAGILKDKCIYRQAQWCRSPEAQFQMLEDVGGIVNQEICKRINEKLIKGKNTE